MHSYLISKARQNNYLPHIALPTGENSPEVSYGTSGKKRESRNFAGLCCNKQKFKQKVLNIFIGGQNPEGDPCCLTAISGLRGTMLSLIAAFHASQAVMMALCLRSGRSSRSHVSARVW